MTAKTESIDYAITITLGKKLRRLCTAEDQYLAIMAIINLIETKSELRFSLIAELHKDYTIHLHGFVNVNNLSKIHIRYRNDLKRYIHEYIRKNYKDDIGFIYIANIDDYNKWYEYCTKDSLKTYKVINYNPVINDALKQFDKVKLDINFPTLIAHCGYAAIDKSDRRVATNCTTESRNDL